MAFPTVDDLPESAASTLLGIFSQLSRSRHPAMARWADSVSHALLARLVSIALSGRVYLSDAEPRRPLATLDGAELDALEALVLAGADASDDHAVATWCTRMSGLILAEWWRRELEQAVIDAKAEAIVAEERRLGCQLNNYTL